VFPKLEFVDIFLRSYIVCFLLKLKMSKLKKIHLVNFGLTSVWSKWYYLQKQAIGQDFLDAKNQALETSTRITQLRSGSRFRLLTIFPICITCRTSSHAPMVLLTKTQMTFSELQCITLIVVILKQNKISPC
jgi:hypothetical protein